MSGKIQSSMKDALINKYGVNLDHSENRMVTEVWDLMQKNVSANLNNDHDINLSNKLMNKCTLNGQTCRTRTLDIKDGSLIH